ncbi:MAG: hypothetical protein GX982_06630, partial [Tissierellia bacterium]|nr:hypothetical protein [Tissierellia bacterium]
CFTVLDIREAVSTIFLLTDSDVSFIVLATTFAVSTIVFEIVLILFP